MRIPYLKKYLSSDPDKAVTKKGIAFRKMISPIIRYSLENMKMFNPYKLVPVRKDKNKTNEPVIYAASHSGDADIANTSVIISEPAYILFGPIDEFLRTFNGGMLTFMGVNLVQRWCKENRRGSLQKSNKILDLGMSEINYYESSYNMSPNKLAQNYHTGKFNFFVKRKEEGKLTKIQPVATHLDIKTKTMYGIEEDRYDITEFNNEEITAMKKIIEDHANKIIDLCRVDESIQDENNRLISSNPISKAFIAEMNEIKKNLKENELNERLVDEIIGKCSEKYKNYFTQFINDKKEYKSESDSEYKSTFDRSIFLYRQIMYVKATVAMNQTLRDKNASATYEMIEKYSYEGKNKKEYEKLNDLLDYLDNPSLSKEEFQKASKELSTLNDKIKKNITPLTEEQRQLREEEWLSYWAGSVDRIKYYDLFEEQGYIYHDPYNGETSDAFIHANGDRLKKYLDSIHVKTKKYQKEQKKKKATKEKR